MAPGRTLRVILPTAAGGSVRLAAAMLSTLLAIAVEHSADHGDKTAFYVAAGAFAAWAVLVAGFGLARETFPRSAGGQRAVLAVSAVLMVATLATAVITAS